jgi:hypothetical protein
MALITLPSSEWIDILTVSGISPKFDTVLRNYGSSTINVIVQASIPTGSGGFPVLTGDMVSVANNQEKIWVKGVSGVRVWIDDQDSNGITLYQSVGFQKDLLTGSGEDILGTKRLRVDQGQTSFWQGKQYRTFQELNIAGGASHTIRIVTGVNTILKGLSLNILTGDARMEVLGGGTAGGTFGVTLPVIRRSTMTVTPVVASLNVLTSGGTQTGGTLLDVVRVAAAEAQGNRKESSVGGSQDDERGVAPGTFFYRINAVGAVAVTGVINISWEER